MIRVSRSATRGDGFGRLIHELPDMLSVGVGQRVGQVLALIGGQTESGYRREQFR